MGKKTYANVMYGHSTHARKAVLVGPQLPKRDTINVLAFQTSASSLVQLQCSHHKFPRKRYSSQAVHSADKPTRVIRGCHCNEAEKTHTHSHHLAYRRIPCEI